MKVRTSLIFDNGASRCFASHKIDFIELVENPGANKFKAIVTGSKIKVKGGFQYNLEVDILHVISIIIKVYCVPNLS